MSINVHCPVCGRYVSIIGRDKIARQNNYNTRAPGTKWSYLPCKGSGANGGKVADEARRAQELLQTKRDLRDAESHLNRARSDADKANAWASKCLDDVTRLRAKLASMQPDESAESEAPAAELVATLEVAS